MQYRQDSIIMADNIENIYFDDDFNIVLIDPNTVVDSSGFKRPRSIKQENLVMYANLEAVSVPRTQLAVGQDLESGITNTTVAAINFLKPTDKNYFDTSYTDETTGARNTQGGTVNQIKFNQGQNPQLTNYVDTQVLGIRDINVQIQFNGIPTVTMTLVDVQGRSLFQTGGNSPYSVFLYYPYPMFKLTLKGYYGKAIQYQLMLLNFQTSFEASSGNYIVTLKFISRTSAMLDDIRLGYLYGLPHMYTTTNTLNNETPNTSSAAVASVQSTGVGNTQELTTVKTTKGYSKLRKVFEAYKEKKLIDQNVPVLTVNEMSEKLKKYTEYLNKEFEKLDFSNIVALDRYNESVNDFSNELLGWKSEYLDGLNPIVTNISTNNLKLFPLKDLITNTNTDTVSNDDSSVKSNCEKQVLAESKLKEILDKYYKIFNSVPGPLAKQITLNLNDFTVNFFKTIFTQNDIDYVTTYEEETGKSVDNPDTDLVFKQWKERKILEIKNYGRCTKGNDPKTIPVGEKNSFFFTLDLEIANIRNIKGQIEQKRKQEETKLNNILKTKVRTNSNNSDLSFRPTVRNVIGVLMASVDAFYQLMNDVHEKAWDKRNDSARLKSIINDAPSQEGKNVVRSSTVQNPNFFVYPWPQFVQKKETNEKVEYQVTYPGAENVKSLTQAYNSDIWPEVEFVEEYLKAVVQKDKSFDNNVLTNDNIVLTYTPEHAIELPLKNVVYQQLTNPEYVYEMYERLYLNVFYSGLFYINSNNDIQSIVKDIEISNVEQSNPSGPLKDQLINNVAAVKLYDYLSSTKSAVSGGTLWSTFISQNFVTPYISDLVQNSFEILTPKEFSSSSTNPIKIESLNKIQSFVENTQTTETTLFDTYPFIINSFSDKMSGTPNKTERYTTTSTYTFNDKKLILTNSETKNLKPFTRAGKTLDGYDTTTSIFDNQKINQFYEIRYSSADKNYLEGNVTYTTDNNVNTKQTVNILNTPYFSNAIIESASSDDNLTKLGYLFLNSLPLTTLYERYLASETIGDYIFAGLNKFSAVHKLPYAWILKLGSVWFRYKKYIETNVDILDSIWKNFDYKKAYDPLNSNPNKIYNIFYGTNTDSPHNFQLNNGTSIQSGFYPLLINSFYKVLTNQNLFPTYETGGNFDLNSNPIFDTLKVIASSPFPTVPDGPITSYYVYLNITNEYTNYLGTNSLNKKMIFPSSGYIPFQQSYFELRSQLQKNQNVTYSELVNSNSMYNGTTRLYWNSPNYGWFDNSQIKKPTPFEYMKYVNPNLDRQEDFTLGTEYSSIEDLFGVFTKEQLDIFGNEFEEFCKRNGESNIFQPGEIDSKYKSIINVLKEMFILETSQISDNGIATDQSNLISQIIEKFISIDVHVKIGNPKKFNRQQFGNFSNNPTFIPQGNQNFYGGTYTDGTAKLPSSTLTLAQSKSLYKTEWDTLYKNVGFSTIDGISYGETSTIYDFFIDNNKPFSVPNIENLAPLIKIYATQKNLNSNYTTTNFSQDISNFLNGLENKRSSVELMLRSKLPSLGDIKQANVEGTSPTLDGDIVKLEQYELFKAINDKWVSGTDYTKKFLFEEFLFFDRANRDIGDELIINTDTIRKYCSWDNASTSIMSLIREVLSNNRMNFLVMPAYINFYGITSSSDGKRTQSIVNNANDVFGTYNYVDFTSFAPKFLCQYIDRPSQTLQLDSDPNYPFKDDGFDLGNPTNNPIRQTGGNNNLVRNNKAVGFVVDFATMNQSVFKSVDINQEQGVTSSEQIQTIIDMGNQGAGKKTMQQTTALFEFYKNRSYNCSVKTFGNVMIQPTMYFVLRHMPMFNGTYIVRNVKHNISSGSFSTEFEGQRISANINTTISDELASVNENFSKKLSNKVKELVTSNRLVTFDNNLNQYITGQEGKNFILNGTIPYLGFIVNASNIDVQDCFENINPVFGSLETKKYVESTITPTALSKLLSQKYLANTNDIRVLRTYLFCMLFLQNYDTNDITIPMTYKQNNLWGVITDVQFNGELPKKVNGCRCLNSSSGTQRPFASFETIGDNIDFVGGFYENKIKEKFNGFDFVNGTEENLIDNFIELFYNTWYTSGSVVKTYNEDSNYQTWKTKASWALSQAKILKLF
jgi:hypothetical protein